MAIPNQFAFEFKSIDPFEQDRREHIRVMAEFGDRRVLFPDVVQFEEVFEVHGRNKSDVPQLSNISSYCYVSGVGECKVGHYSIYVLPTRELINAINEKMFFGMGTFGGGAYFQICVHDTGVAAIYAKFEQIIGDRFLALVDAASIPQREIGATSIELPESPLPVDVLTVLSQCTCDGNVVKLPCQLPRDLYTKVANILKNLGGPWIRKAGGHVFKEDPAGLIDDVIVTGRVKKPEKFGYFPTQRPLAESVVQKADIRPGMTVLEPEAGSADLADVVAEKTDKNLITCCELQDKNVVILSGKGYRVVPGDFLAMTLDFIQFDRVVMNPPFERQADILHVLHAWNFVKPKGRLTSIMSAGILFRQDRLTTEFREFVEQYRGEITENPEGSFKASGTGVRTVTLVIDKPVDYSLEEDLLAA